MMLITCPVMWLHNDMAAVSHTHWSSYFCIYAADRSITYEVQSWLKWMQTKWIIYSSVVMHDVQCSHFYCFGFCLVFTPLTPLVYFPSVSMCSMFSSLALVYLHGWVYVSAFGCCCSLGVCSLFAIFFLYFVLLYPPLSLSHWGVLTCICYFKPKTCFHVSVSHVLWLMLIFMSCLIQSACDLICSGLRLWVIDLLNK